MKRSNVTTKTLRVRIRDKHAKVLDRMARDVNFVWNYYNELSYRFVREKQHFISAVDMQKYTKGASKDLSIDSTAIQEIADEYATRRLQFKKAKLRWRVSHGAKKSLGWIPFKKGAAKWVSGQVRYAGHFFNVWDSYGLSQYEFRAGDFSQDARGRWYFNVAVAVTPQSTNGTEAIALDLGLKEVATASDGTCMAAGRWYRDMEEKLAAAQRAGKKSRVKAIHAKIKNRRKNDMHQYSRDLVNRSAAIFVGNVCSSSLTKTRMAKSVLDAGWSTLKTMLEYKCDHAGIIFEEINEAYTTQTCSACNSRTGPSGREGLRIREWTCDACGATHHRDVNAAKNILALGHQRLEGGIPH